MPVMAGLWSNVSMWLGPPYMNRKITLFAFGVKCGSLGASGSVRAAVSCADADGSKNPSAESSEVRATEPKPAPVCQRNSRRVRWQKSGRGMGAWE